MVACLSIRVWIQEDHLILNYLISLGRSRLTGVWVCIDQEPEMRPHPLVHILLTYRTLQFHCKQTAPVNQITRAYNIASTLSTYCQTWPWLASCCSQPLDMHTSTTRQEKSTTDQWTCHLRCIWTQPSCLQETISSESTRKTRINWIFIPWKQNFDTNCPPSLQACTELTDPLRTLLSHNERTASINSSENLPCTCTGTITACISWYCACAWRMW